jgi:gentisate 1,2-dioxygenase
VFHLIEGARRGAIDVDAGTSRWPKPTPAARRVTPPITLRNARADQPAFVFMADEAPLHRKLGVYETRAAAFTGLSAGV